MANNSLKLFLLIAAFFQLILTTTLVLDPQIFANQAKRELNCNVSLSMVFICILFSKASSELQKESII